MNSRTAYKLMLKCRRKNMWGTRSLVAVRLPLSLADEPPPESEFKEENVEIKLPNSNYKTIQICHVNGPRESEKEWGHPRYLISSDRYCADRCEWWEGWYLITTKSLSDDSYNIDTDVIETGDLDEKSITDYAKYKKWEDKYIHGINSWDHKGSPVNNPVLKAFHEASFWAKTTYGGVEKDKIYIVYSVKLAYMKDFAPHLSKAMKIAKKHNIKVRAFPAYV